MSPSALNEVFSSLVPLRATCSASVPCVDLSILYNGRLENRVSQPHTLPHSYVTILIRIP